MPRSLLSMLAVLLVVVSSNQPPNLGMGKVFVKAIDTFVAHA